MSAYQYVRAIASCFWQVVDHWQTLIAGVFALVAAIAAVLLAIRSEQRKANRELKSLRRALGVEIRLYTASAYKAHLYCKECMLLSPIPSGFLIEDRATLPAPVIYANAAAKIGEFGDCAAVLVRFFTSISVAREAAARLRHHPLANNMPASEIAKAADGLIKIAAMGMELFPFFETDIESEDGVDSDAVENIQQASKEWNACTEDRRARNTDVEN